MPPRARLHINQDVVAGLMFIAWGVAALWFGRRFPVGSAMRMGPGYFPLVLSWLLIGFGGFIAVRGALVEGQRLTRWYWRPLVMVLLTFLIFAALIDRAGLALAGVCSIFIGAMGGPDFRWREALILALGLTAAAVALFIYALGLPMSVWPK
jgi:hypothetical protein